MKKERAACCENIGLKKGAWTSSEDRRLIAYIQKHGHGNWRALPKQAGLTRCGKSCRLRWINYLRPGLKRGNITKDEEEIIINLHAMLGNKWSKIAACLPGRTDNEIKNVWNTHLKKRFAPKESKNSQKKTKAAANSSELISCSDMGSITNMEQSGQLENTSKELKTDLLIELEECLASEDLELSVNDYQPITLPSASYSNNSTANSEFNMLVELEECLAMENSQQISSASSSCSHGASAANQDSFLIELDECLACSVLDVLGDDYCKNSSSSTDSSQMDVEFMMNISDLPDIGSEIWSMLDHDSSNGTPINLEESLRPNTLEEINSTRKGWLAYLEKELDLC